MNKRILSISLTLAVLGLACAYASTTSGYASQTTSSVSIAPQGNLIVATTVTNWDTRASDTLAVVWTAPQGSFCKSSQFVISRGNDTSNDVSWAYRTVVHAAANGNETICSGPWVAKVVNVNSGVVLASAGYVVSPAPVAQNVNLNSNS